jgi:16S rRNA (adenine1518-N6/adenine1519-N6)-dimethyltransferase
MNPDHVQTKREIAARLESAGIRPRKKHGQHFLIDGNLMRRLAAAAEIAPTDVVLEVGPGTGGLTDLLLERAGRVIAVEIDRGLHDILRDRFAAAMADRRLQLLHADVLEGKHHFVPEFAALLVQLAEGAAPGRVLLVANLPYGVATPVVMNLLVDYPWVKRLVFTVQAEVGDRFDAEPGTRAYGPLSILARLLCDIRVVARVPAQAFWPQPEVESVMLRLDVRGDAPETLRGRGGVHGFAGLLRRTFDHRRKTLRSALAYAVERDVRDRICAAIDGARRPESLTPAEWLELFNRVLAAADGSATRRGIREC